RLDLFLVSVPVIVPLKVKSPQAPLAASRIRRRSVKSVLKWSGLATVAELVVTTKPSGTATPLPPSQAVSIPSRTRAKATLPVLLPLPVLLLVPVSTALGPIFQRYEKFTEVACAWAFCPV